MQLYPAIDLKNGQCVRLSQGRMEDAVVYHPDPVAQAVSFVESGAKRLHLVDLDGAFAGNSVNGSVVKRIIQAVNVPVQLGGGIRTLDDLKAWLDMGLARAIIGSAATENPELLVSAAQTYPDQVVLGLDSRDGQVMIKGWAEGSGQNLDQVLDRFSGLPLAAIIHTDIARDGMKTGVNHQATEALGQKTSIPVIASGGLGSLDDLRTLLECAHIAGVVTGRALYDGSLDLSRALSLTD